MVEKRVSRTAVLLLVVSVASDDVYDVHLKGARLPPPAWRQASHSVPVLGCMCAQQCTHRHRPSLCRAAWPHWTTVCVVMLPNTAAMVVQLLLANGPYLVPHHLLRAPRGRLGPWSAVSASGSAADSKVRRRAPGEAAGSAAGGGLHSHGALGEKGCAAVGADMGRPAPVGPAGAPKLAMSAPDVCSAVPEVSSDRMQRMKFL